MYTTFLWTTYMVMIVSTRSNTHFTFLNCYIPYFNMMKLWCITCLHRHTKRRWNLESAEVEIGKGIWLKSAAVTTGQSTTQGLQTFTLLINAGLAFLSISTCIYFFKVLNNSCQIFRFEIPKCNLSFRSKGFWSSIL